jgi:hypothetical protein
VLRWPHRAPQMLQTLRFLTDIRPTHVVSTATTPHFATLFGTKRNVAAFRSGRMNNSA